MWIGHYHLLPDISCIALKFVNFQVAKMCGNNGMFYGGTRGSITKAELVSDNEVAPIAIETLHSFATQTYYGFKANDVTHSRSILMSYRGYHSNIASGHSITGIR